MFVSREAIADDADHDPCAGQTLQELARFGNVCVMGRG
jgi:hypothetical protein